jgi:hypothetical protein
MPHLRIVLLRPGAVRTAPPERVLEEVDTYSGWLGYSVLQRHAAEHPGYLVALEWWRESDRGDGGWQRVAMAGSEVREQGEREAKEKTR